MIEYFQDGSSQIAFLIGGSTEHKIKDWLSCVEDNFSTFKILSRDITSMTGGRGLIFDFDFLDDTRICIRIQDRWSNPGFGFSSAFQASQISGVKELVENLPIQFNPYRISNDRIIFNVCPGIYRHIAAWKNWNLEEAFTSRYSYNFQKRTDGISLFEEYIQVFDRATKSLCLIIIDHDELYTGESAISSTYSSEKLISRHVAVLNSCIDRDYSMMQEYQEIRRFYPEYDQGIRIFFNELGIQSKYESFPCD